MSNSLNSVNSVNSYSAVLPPSPMVFFNMGMTTPPRLNIVKKKLHFLIRRLPLVTAITHLSKIVQELEQCFVKIVNEAFSC